MPAGCSTGTEEDRPEEWSGGVLFHVPLGEDGAWTECRPVPSCARGPPHTHPNLPDRLTSVAWPIVTGFPSQSVSL